MIERHRRYLRASRNRQRKRNLAKKRAMAGETMPPTPDTVEPPSSSLRRSNGGVLTSLPAGNTPPAAPPAPVVGEQQVVGTPSRDRDTVTPAKVRKTEAPSKKKEPWYMTRKAVRKERLASQRTADRETSGSGAASTPRRKIEIATPISSRSSGKPKVPSPKNEDLRLTIASRRQSASRSRSTSKGGKQHLDPTSTAIIKSIVEGLSASLDRRFRRRSPSPQAHCSHQSSRRSRYPSHLDEAAYRSYYGDTEDEDSKSRSRSRSRSRGRSRQRQPPPARGKGKGRGKGRGK